MSAGFDTQPSAVKTENSISLTYALNTHTTAISVTYKKTGTGDTPTPVNDILLTTTTFTISSLLEGTTYTINFKLTNSSAVVTNTEIEHTTRGFVTQPSLTNISDASVTLVYQINNQAEFTASLLETGGPSTPINNTESTPFTQTGLTLPG
jgi:hypothetical protein